MKQYLDLMRQIKETGVVKTDRTGTGTVSIFAPQMRFDLRKGFPLVTTKKTHLKSIIYELLWFLRGDTNTQYLHENGVGIWDEWQDENGDLGPIYGKQWVSWTAADGHVVNQIQQMVDLLKNSPDSRRMVVSAWNVAELPQMKLTPCHCLFQFYTAPLSHKERLRWYINSDIETRQGITETDEAFMERIGVPKFRLDCQLYQRSADFFLGVPFNIASYALLTMMMAQVTNMVAGEFIWTGGDTHLYSNHAEQVDRQLAREPHPLPTMRLNKSVNSIFDFKFEDFTLEGYESHPGIKAPVAV